MIIFFFLNFIYFSAFLVVLKNILPVSALKITHARFDKKKICVLGSLIQPTSEVATLCQEINLLTQFLWRLEECLYEWITMKFAIFWLCCLILPVTFSAKCKIIPLSVRDSIKADVVFSGTVVSFLIRRGPRVYPRTYAAKVKVKTVFRNGDIVTSGDEVIVEGLGNPKICVSRPMIGDSRIFFLDRKWRRRSARFPVAGEHFRLRSSLLRLTMKNLEFLMKLDDGGNETGQFDIFYRGQDPLLLQDETSFKIIHFQHISLVPLQKSLLTNPGYCSVDSKCSCRSMI